ncbi:MAG: hypothetical protein P8R54_31925 [Myxococcota bacterium]|nr:hypothetical protein [Myxococcota bacterium]
MARRKALLFTDTARFIDYVRLGTPKSTSSRGFELLEVTWPATRQRALILLGHRARSWSLLQRTSLVFKNAPAQPFTHIEILTTDEGLSWLDDDQQRPCTVHSRHSAHKLIELIALLPWHDAPASGPVIFRSSDVAALERLVLDSLALENDRIQVAALSTEELLLKIETPSWFLLQRCIEDDSAITLYAPMPGADGQAWVQWGWRHPMAALWCARLDPGAMVLFTPGRARQELAAPDWQDLYDTAEVVLDVSADPLILPSVEITERFTITVHLAPRARPSEGALWLIEDSERSELERLLGALDDTDLDDLLVASVEAPGKPTRFLIRERHTGTGRKFIRFSPHAFSHWPGVPDLFIPSDKTLLPHLRRDRYRALFSLKPGWLSILIHADELLQVSNAAFVPLSRLVDYQISTEAVRIEPLMARNLFEFAPYTRAPSRPELMVRKHREQPRSESIPYPTQPEESSEAPAQRVKQPVPSESIPEDAPTAQHAPAEPLSALTRQERILELEIIEEPTSNRWSDLSRVKSEQGLSHDAFRSSAEAWWLASQKSHPAHHAQILTHLSQHLSLTGSPAAQARQALQQDSHLGALTYALLGRLLPPGHIDGWVLQAARLLRSYQDDLPKKLRWLAWGEIWKINRDVRAQASIRTQILSDLDAAGLSPMDVPAFLQERLLKERDLVEEQDAGEVSRAVNNLEGIYTSIQRMPKDLRCGGMAVLARAYQHLGRPDRANLCQEQARAESTSAFVTAWIRLFASPPHPSDTTTGLPSLEADALREVADSLRARKDEESPLSFLSAKNLGRLYPDTPGLRRNALYSHLNQITSLRRKNDRQRFVQEMGTWLSSAAEQADAVNSRDIATLVHMAIREIARMQASSIRSDLNRHFSAFSKQCLRQIGARDDYFSMLFQLSLAQASLDLNKPAVGLRILSQTMTLLRGADCITLDLVDVCAAAVQVLESAELTQRGSAIDGLLQAMVAQTMKLPDLASSSNTLSILRLIDQLCEASISKDRITLGRYRRYQDRDELLIRERILSEDHCI